MKNIDSISEAYLDVIVCEETKPDLLYYTDPHRKENTGTPTTKDELIKFHKKKLEDLGPDAPKSHFLYHKKFLKKLGNK